MLTMNPVMPATTATISKNVCSHTWESHEITPTIVWNQITEFFCQSNKTRALVALCTSMDKTKTFYNRKLAFNELRTLARQPYQDQFKITVHNETDYNDRNIQLNIINNDRQTIKLHREPLNNIIKEELLHHYGGKAGQFISNTDDNDDSGLTDAEKMAIGLYTTQEFSELNRNLRLGNSLNSKLSLVNECLASAFKKSKKHATILKTYRGTSVFKSFHKSALVSVRMDAFINTPEGSSTRDPAYLSTSRGLEVAKAATEKTGTLSILFGQSGKDISNFSFFKTEKEVLYNKNTKMNVLLSVKKGVQHMAYQVLEEANLPKGSGQQDNLINALNLEKTIKV